jgi:hypothetical protein
MSLGFVNLGNLSVSRMLIGGNPFSGFAHQTPERGAAMRQYYTPEHIQAALRQAESLGINTFLGRADAHIISVLKDYWAQGGSIQWIAQTASEAPTQMVAAQTAIAGGCKACYIHGGVIEYLLAQGKEQDIYETINIIKAAGLPAGVAGHIPHIFDWAEEHLDLDFYLCSYYNPSPRDKQAGYSDAQEHYLEEDRQRMLARIETFSHPVIHYKVMAAGRNDPKEALFLAARNMRPGDAVCVGFFVQDNPNMIAEDIAWLEQGLARK